MTDAPGPPLSEEIKRRQVALMLRYVTATRALKIPPGLTA